MKGAGFQTAAFPASFILSAQFGLNQGFDTYDAPPPPKSQQSFDSERSADAGTDLALSWLAGHPAGKSFLWLHYYDPHWPYAPPFPFSAQFKDAPYDGEIAAVDAQLARLFAVLRKDPAWARTLLIVVGDHGEGLYEHGERFHSLLAYETTLHVPLIIKAPGGARSRRVATPVTLADLTPTVLDFAGVPIPGPMQGISLRRAIDGGELPRRDLYFETLVGALNYGWSSLRGVRDGKWKFIDSSRPELFDLAVDPAEMNNLASSEAQRVADMREGLAALESSTTKIVEHRDVAPTLDPATLATLASLGYVSGGGTGPTTTGGPHPQTLIDLEPEMLAAQDAVAARRWDRVEETCRYVLTRDAANRFALYHLALALADTGRPQQAEPFARQLVTLYPDSETNHDLLAQILIARKQPAEAREVLRKALDVFPKSEGLRYHEVLAKFDAGDADACNAVDRAVAEHPGSGRVRVLKARCQARKGDVAGALASLSEARLLGFLDFDLLRQHPEFKTVVARPEFEALLRSAPLAAPRPSP